MTIHRQKNIISTINKTFPFWGYGFNVFDWRSAVFINSEQAKRLSKIIKLRYNLVITVNRLLIFSLLLPINIFAQQPQPPKPPTFEPIKTGHYYTTVPNHQDNTYQKPQKTVPLGATAQDIINKTHGQGPIYTPNMTPQQRQQANMRYIQQQMANDPAYQLPNKSNTFSQNFNRSQQQKVAEILNEIHPTTNNNRNNAGYYKSPQFKQLTKPYTEALQQLKQQLTNNNISVRNAYYTIENAYGNPYLNKNEFNDLIKQSVEFIKIWLTQNGYSLKDKHNPNGNMEIVFTGLRPGEKLYEELLASSENTLPTHHPQILIGKVHEGDPQQIRQLIGEMIAAAGEARAQGAVFAWGNFLTVVINFLILAWIIFLMVKGVNRLEAGMPVAFDVLCNEIKGLGMNIMLEKSQADGGSLL